MHSVLTRLNMVLQKSSFPFAVVQWNNLQAQAILYIQVQTKMQTTVNSKIFARALFLQNFSSLKFRENKTLRKSLCCLPMYINQGILFCLFYSKIQAASQKRPVFAQLWRFFPNLRI